MEDDKKNKRSIKEFAARKENERKQKEERDEIFEEKKIQQQENQSIEIEKENIKMEDRPIIDSKRMTEPVNREFRLPNETVFVRFIAKQRGSIDDKTSPMWGGMAETASKTFVVPRLRNGNLANILTNAECAFFEKAFNLPEGAFNIYNKGDDNYWLDSTKNAVNKVVLTKAGLKLDLSNKEDYIKYKILLANTNTICPSENELKKKPKSTYMFVLCNEKLSEEHALANSELKFKCYQEYGRIRSNKRLLKYIAETMSGHRLSVNVEFRYLYPIIDGFIEDNADRFYEIITDPLTPGLALLMEAIDYNVVRKEVGMHYMTDSNEPLCASNNKPTAAVAADWITRPENYEIKTQIEEQIKRKKF